MSQENRTDQRETIWARPARQRPGVALVAGSGAGPERELNQLLRRRLRIAGTIALCASAAVLIKWFVYGEQFLGPSAFDQAMHAIAVAVQVMCCVLLWTRLELSTRVLRLIELALFGFMAGYLALIQVHLYGLGTLLEGIPDHQKEGVLALANIANAFRWFLLIVLYGTFIPNTWRRCARIVGAFIVLPLTLNFAVCYPDYIMGQYIRPVMFDTTVVLGVGAAIALFGSYKLSELEHEASEARKLGQYRLLRRLGSGGMGEVYLGEHMLLRRACAIKIIRPDQASDDAIFARFEREVQAMATMTHWNTVEIYDYGHAEDGTFYYVMEYLPGLNLYDLVRRFGPLAAGRAIHFLRQLCTALGEAHAIGLIHRDIKPTNVIACKRGLTHDVAKLLDFGLVHELGMKAHQPQLTLHGTILGTPAYIAPEQARGRGVIDVRTDIYSLGALAYFLVTGQAPFVRDSVFELLAAHLNEAVVPPRQLRPELPADLEEVILTCLHKDPAERWASVQEVDAALAACEAMGDWDARQAETWWSGLTVLDSSDPAGTLPTIPVQPA